MKEHLFLYGPPASGKSTLGGILASRFNLPFSDLDADIESKAGKGIPEIFAEEGEPGFRRRELEALCAVASGGPRVVALGGGALLAPEARKVAEDSGFAVALDVPAETLRERASKARGSRPLAADSAALDSLLEKRAAHYATFPRASSLSGYFTVEARGEPSRMFVGRGMLASAAMWLRAAGCTGRVLVVSDTNAGPLYAERLRDALNAGGFTAEIFTFRAGEESKTLATVASIWNACLKAGLSRRDTLVSVGGGVVGDLSGFAAATWMRGIRWVNVPTTLLAMVDSSFGGKTGFDLPEGKNLVGAFHQPEIVLADTDVLATLPTREFRNGLAEAIKHSIISPGAFHGVSCPQPEDSSDGDGLSSFAAAAVSVKAGIVASDPFEKTGERAKLNLGHTVGHAVEVLTGFKVSHGEAVAIGTVEEARLAERKGLAAGGFGDEVAAKFSAAGLPVSLPAGLSFDDLVPVMKRDKKNSDGRIRYALPFAMGDVRLTSP